MSSSAKSRVWTDLGVVVIVFLFLTPVLFSLGKVTVDILLWARLQSRLAWNGLLAPQLSWLMVPLASQSCFFTPSFLPMTMSFWAWLIRPYVAISRALLNLHLKQDSLVYCYVVTALVTTGSISFLDDIIFRHHDAQKATTVLMTPIFQGFITRLLLPIAP